MSSSHGVVSLSMNRLCHLPTAFGSQVTRMIPCGLSASHLKVSPCAHHAEQGPSACASQAETAAWSASFT
ncbi:hypothetical protein D3C78_1742200 [compost metagenome]